MDSGLVVVTHVVERICATRVHMMVFYYFCLSIKFFSKISISAIVYSMSDYTKLSIHRRQDFENEILLSSSLFPDVLQHSTITLTFKTKSNVEGSFTMRLNMSPTHAKIKVSLLRDVADVYNLSKDDSVLITLLPDTILSNNPKANPNSSPTIDFLTVTIKDQFLSRSDMYQLKQKLIDIWLYEGEFLDMMGCRVAVKELRQGPHIMKSGIITNNTVFTFRSRSARVVWLVQISSEMYDYVPRKINRLRPDDPYEDCVLNFDKFVTFMYHLFDKWRDLEVTHSLSVIFFSRTYIGNAQSQCNQPPGQNSTSLYTDGDQISTIQTDVDGRRFVDHYKPVIENETRTFWESLIFRIKKEFVAYPATLKWNINSPNNSRIPSVASQGNLLEAINTTLNVLQFHYMDRDLQRTGNSIVIVSAGCGVFEVNKDLASITKQRMMDNGIGSDCVSLSLPPLHVTPFFMYKVNKGETPPSSQPIEEMINDWKRYFESPHWLNVCFVDNEKDKYNEKEVDRKKTPR